MCPGHLVEKWKREVLRLYPGSSAYIINNFDDVNKLDHIIRNKNKKRSVFLIVSKDTAKISFTKRPAVIYDKNRKCFICPKCGSILINSSIGRSGVYDAIEHCFKITYKDAEDTHPTYEFKDAALLAAFRDEFNDNAYCMLLDSYKSNRAVKEHFVKTNRFVRYYNFNIVNLSHSRQHYSANGSFDLVPYTCNNELWTAANNEENSKWNKYPGFGFIHDDMIPMIKRDYKDIEQNPNKYSKSEKDIINKAYKAVVDAEDLGLKKMAPRRYSIAKFIRQRYKGLIDYFIADEVHMYASSNSAQANAFGDFVKVAKKTIALTGTLLNGYASSIYHILFRMYPRTFVELGYKYGSVSAFVNKFGIEKTTIKINNLRRTKTKKICPGVSPELFTKFLLDKAIFVSLSDMSTGLPKYTETPVPVDMTPDVHRGYNRCIGNIRRAIDNTRDSNNRMSVAFMAAQKLNLYADQPYDIIPVIDNNDYSKYLVEFPDAVAKENRKTYLSPKDEKTLEIVQSKLEKGENVLIYVDYVNSTDCISRLERMFKDNNIKSCTLTASVVAKKREEWIDDKVRNGYRVLICNPRLVETGLDLLSFTNIIFYQLGYNLFTMRQASRRSLRLNQPNNVNVYFLYFKDTAQEMVLSLMASKLQAAMAIEGKFSEEGLTAMSNNDSILARIANSLIENIEYKVEEGAFKTTFEAEEDDGSRFKMVYILDKKKDKEEYSLFKKSKGPRINMKALKVQVV